MARRIGWLGFSYFCAVALIGGGCGGQPKPPAKQPASLQQGSLIGDKEALEFGEKLCEAISAGDRAKITQLFDMSAMIEMITGGLGMAPGAIKSITGELGATLGQSLSKPFGAEAGGGKVGRVSVVRIRGRDGGRWALLRLVGLDQSVQYIEIALARRHGEVRAIDVYNIVIAERVTQVMRNLLIQSGARADRGLFDRLTEQEREFAKHDKDLEAMAKAKQAGNWRDGQAIYRRLPDSIRNSKVGLFYRITFAQALMAEDEKGFLDAVAEFRARYPEEAGINLIAIDAHLLRKEYGKALECVDWLNESIGGDPYLDIMRANISIHAGNAASAKEFAVRVSKVLPEYPEPIYSLIDVSLAERAYGDTRALLRKLRDGFGVEIPGMESNELFADFVKSPEYREWIKE